MKLKSSIKVYVGIPWLRGGDEYENYLPRCLNAIHSQQTMVRMMPPRTSPPYPGRFQKGHPEHLYAIMDRMNAVVESFTRTDATHLWMVDADVEPPPHALETLIRHDVDIASGVYPFHNFGLVPGRKPPCRAMMGGRMADPDCGMFIPRDWDEMKGVVLGKDEKVSAGTGCMLVKRRVFERHHPQIPPLRFDRRGGKCGADVYFWKRAQDAGFTARLDANVVCGHLPYYPLNKINEWLV